MEKKMVWKTIKSISAYDFEGTLDDVIKTLNKFKEDYPDGDPLRIDVSYGGYDDDYAFNLQKYRLETDEECKAREEREAADKARWDAQDKIKYEELKKKFEGK